MCKANSLSLDLDIFKVWAGERLGPISTVCRHQRYGVAIVIYPLEGGLIADADGGYLTIIHLGLDTDIHDISILYSGVYHTISTAAEAEIAVDSFRHVHIVLDVFLSGDGLAASDTADQGLFDHLGEGFKARRNAIHGRYGIFALDI